MSFDPNWNPQDDEDVEVVEFTVLDAAFAFLELAMRVFGVIILMIVTHKLITGVW
jgi:hypothetical protein